MPPNMSPEQMEKMQQFIDVLADGIAKNWDTKGVFKYLIDNFANQISNGHPVSPHLQGGVRQEKVVMVRRKRNGHVVEEPTTGAQLLAEIADKQQDMIDAIDDLLDELPSKKRRR